MFKQLNKESNTLVGAAAIVGLFSLLSRLMGFLRDRLLAGEFGAGKTLDAFYAAFRIPDTLYSLLIVGAISASFIPLFVRRYKTDNRPDLAWTFANNTLHVLLLIIGIFALFGAMLAPKFAPLIAPGFSPEKQQLVAQFMRPLLLSQTILTISLVFSSALQGLKRFLLSSIAPILYNVGIILGALLFVPRFGPIGLAWGVVLGACLHAGIQWVGVSLVGYKYRPLMSWRDADVRTLLRDTGPRTIALGITQIQAFVLGLFATSLPEGSVTAFQFASNIQYMVVGTIGVSFALAAYPSFADYLSKRDDAAFSRLFSITIRQLLFLLTPCMVIFLLLRTELVRLVVGAGAYNWDATIVTATALGFFTLSFFTQSIVPLLNRAFFSLRDQWTPLTISIGTAAIGIAVGHALLPRFGLSALPIGLGVTATLDAALLWGKLRRKIGSLGEWRIIKTLYQITICGLLAALAVQFSKPLSLHILPLTSFFGVLLRLVVSAGIGGLVYVGTALLLRVEEAHEFVAGFHRKFFKRFSPTEPVQSV